MNSLYLCKEKKTFFDILKEYSLITVWKVIINVANDDKLIYNDNNDRNCKIFLEDLKFWKSESSDIYIKN